MNFLLVLLLTCWVVTRAMAGGKRGSRSRSSSRSSSEENSNKGMFSHLFTEDEIEEISSNKRIRREIRDLSKNQWNRVATAMNIMKHISEEEGQEIYGSDYRSYDSLVCQHMRATRHRLGDLMHLGPHFLVTHRAFVLAFENSLIAIDPKIDGAPYWNYYIDVLEYGNDLTNSIIFSDKYYGSFSGDESLDYVITDGKFRFWKVNDDPNDLQCNGSYRNAFGQLRQQNNPENSKYVTRMGGNTCNGEFSQWNATQFLYEECLSGNYTDNIIDFFSCMNFPVHASGHFAVGGTRARYPNQTVDDWPSCVNWHAGGSLAVNNVRKFAFDYGCFDCPFSGDCILGVDDITCGECEISNNGTCDIEGVEYNVSPKNVDSQHIIGDFYDLSTSPNDAIFFAHHSNVDRYFMEWQLYQFNNKPYYGYPESGYELGINLDDVMMSEYPLVDLFNNDSLSGQPLTFRNVLDQTDFVDASYTYDTIIDLIDS